MGEKIIVGPINRGLRTDVLPFVIDNDSFPTLTNAYQWRGRVKRKRGTSLLGRLRRFQGPLSFGNFDAFGGFSANIFSTFSYETNASIVPGSVSLITAANTFTDINPVTLNPPDGTLFGLGGGVRGKVNYVTGQVDITVPFAPSANQPATITFIYYPDLPVMGLEDLSLTSSQFPGTLAFDTVYSYNIKTSFPYPIYSVSFYKNPPTLTYPGYTQKTSWTPTTWNGFDYQQFWTTNYENALWATNGIDVDPTTLANIGMQYKFITGIAIITAGNGTTIPAVADITIVAHGLVQGDFLFINEVSGITGINFQTGYVTSADPQAANLVRVTFPNAILAGVYTTGGIAQYLTNRSDVTKDCLRWYDGDPTNTISPLPSTGNGWVNFAPPLFFNSNPIVPIGDQPLGQYYLVGARLIVPFKDRLLFFGPVIQTSVAGSQVYLQDTIIYSQNGTPYYTCSFTGDPLSATTVFNPILVPNKQTATATAYFVDQTGFAGFITAGVSQPILTVGNNQDSLIVGFTRLQTKVIFTGNDVEPFLFYITNSELGSGSTFSSIIMDEGVITRGNRGYIITDQTRAARIDLEIPDDLFQMKLTNNGSERFCAQRDFLNEWIYFTYPDNYSSSIYPNRTLLYNYRDNSWGMFNECYTTYGQFMPLTGLTWADLTLPLTWSTWDDPWNSGSNTLLQPQVIAGNQQGFVIFREDKSTDEDSSLYIQGFSGNVITSPNHCLNNGDYIIINGCLGTVGPLVNGVIFLVSSATTNTFTVNSPPIIIGSYDGGGTITRMYIPYIQTKQFPVSWGFARKTRLGPQQYLLSSTDDAQIQLLIFLSQNVASPYNTGPIVPDVSPANSSLIYSTVLYTCVESTNLGLTPANINLQMVTGSQQSQIWHRMNTSLIGDTVQIGFTLSPEQMTTLDDEGDFISQFAEIEIHGFILDVNPSQLLA